MNISNSACFPFPTESLNDEYMLNLHNELKFGNLKLKSRPPDLNGFENLSGTATSITNDDDGKLKDMNLENGMGSADAPFTFIWAQRQGIYKVILYAKQADASIADWQVIEKSSEYKNKFLKMKYWKIH